MIFQGPGNELGLAMIMKDDVHDSFCPSSTSDGLTVLVHNPNDFPKIARYGVAVPNGFESRIVIKPTISEANIGVYDS